MTLDKTWFHRITIRPQKEGKILSGENAELLLDGEPLLGVKALNVRLRPGELCVVTMQLTASVDIEGIAVVNK